jgi:hypothetical protein
VRLFSFLPPRKPPRNPLFAGKKKIEWKSYRKIVIRFFPPNSSSLLLTSLSSTFPAGRHQTVFRKGIGLFSFLFLALERDCQRLPDRRHLSVPEFLEKSPFSIP